MSDLWQVYEYAATGHAVPLGPPLRRILAQALHTSLERAEAETEHPRSFTTRPGEMSGCTI